MPQTGERLRSVEQAARSTIIASQRFRFMVGS